MLTTSMIITTTATLTTTATASTGVVGRAFRAFTMDALIVVQYIADVWVDIEKRNKDKETKIWHSGIYSLSCT